MIFLLTMPSPCLLVSCLKPLHANIYRVIYIIHLTEQRSTNFPNLVGLVAYMPAAAQFEINLPKWGFDVIKLFDFDCKWKMNAHIYSAWALQVCRGHTETEGGGSIFVAPCLIHQPASVALISFKLVETFDFFSMSDCDPVRPSKRKFKP